MYRPVLNSRDRAGSIAAVVLIHAGLLFAFLNLSGRLDLPSPQSALEVFDLVDVPPPQPEQPPPAQQAEQPQPQEEEGGSAPENIRSEATPIVAPKPRIALPVPVPVATTETPNQGAAPTQGAADVRGPGTGAGGTGTGTGSGSGGSGTGGGGDGGYAEPPRLLTPVLRGRDFPREMLQQWPRSADVFIRFRVDATGRITECHVDRGTGVAEIDSRICGLAQQRFRYRPALTRSGQPVAGWAGYRQTPPR